jgi:hypothetical protein
VGLQSVRDHYYSVIDSNGMSHYELLSEIIKSFAKKKRLNNHPIFDQDLLYPELCNKLVFDDISNDEVMTVLDELSYSKSRKHG